jgi:predicted RecB family nuclease
MTVRKPSKPWRVLLSRPGGSTRTDYRSSYDAYQDVVSERQKTERGETEVTAIQVHQWINGTWHLYERINPEVTS